MTSDEICEISVITVSLRCGWNRASKNSSLDSPQTLVIGKEEDFVAAIKQFGHHDWTADGKPELVQAKLAFMRLARTAGRTSALEIVSSIELIVAQKLPDGSMEAVGTRFDRRIQNRSAGAAILCAEI